MPFSSENGKWSTDRLVKRLVSEFSYLAPQGFKTEILDVGVGCGTYRDRYIDVLPYSTTNWTGIEVWEPYIEKYNLATKYTNLINEDIREWIRRSSLPKFDLVFVGDILEHMTKEEAVKVINVLLDIGNTLVVAIPIVHYPQPAFEGNPYEEHIKDDWSHLEMMETFGKYVVSWACEQEIGVYFMSNKAYDYKGLFKARIGVYGICKNEQETIARTLISLGAADQILICDTGSTDETLNIINEDRVQLINISVQPWRFDEARNTAMMLMQEDLDVVISIDMDEYMQEGWYEILSEEIEKHIRERGRPYDIYHHRFSTEWDWQNLKPGEKSKNYTSHWHSRIHTRHNWKWALPVHEVLDFTGAHQKQECFLGGLTMYQRPITKTGRSSYLPLLELSIRERPSNWKSWAFYADELYRAGRQKEALDAIDTALQNRDADKGWLYQVRAGYDEETALGSFVQATYYSPNIREVWVAMSKWCFARGKLGFALETLNNAEAIKQPTNDYRFNPWCWGPEFDKYAARVRAVGG